MQSIVSRTVAQKTNSDGFPKPGELIEITGAHALEASDRAILNILYQHAHDSGRLGEPGAEWEIPLTQLRFAISHKGNERVRESLGRLMRVIVTVPLPNAEVGEPAFLMTHLFDFFILPQAETAKSIVRFGLPRKLQPVVAQSNRWGRRGHLRYDQQIRYRPLRADAASY